MLLEQKVARKLIELRKTLSLAESCTGGLLSHRLTNIPGSSQFLLFSIIAYSNMAKSKFLGVPKALIKTHGAVSGPVAEAMAKGARKALKSDFAISLTGIAGPTGGTKAKPVGLVFISLSSHKETVSYKLLFKGSREAIKQQATDEALKLFLNRLV